ncbi:CHAT domain-containing protein [Saccharothrix saharensis]|uniref:CHAT domain-containing protein n=1 Tax=Saccharothrix saharensis TaxID=571190 RepID=UPI0036B95EF6
MAFELGDHPTARRPIGDGAKNMRSAHVNGHGQVADYSKTGEFLHSLVFKDDIARRWREAAADPLRTYLLVEPPELRSVPWELMKYPKGRTLFTSPDRPFVRVDRFPHLDGPKDESDPLLPIRIMVVEGERDSAIGTATEVRAIKQALSATNGRIEAEYLKAPTKQRLIDAYRRLRPHVFHFVGHNTHDVNVDQLALRLRDNSRDLDEMITPGVLRLLQPAPRVAVLNACRTATADEFRALAECFFTDEPGADSAAAVIGMQGNVRGSAAARFGGAFYRALAKGMVIDAAVTVARAEVYEKGDALEDDGDWFLPVLTVRGDAEHVLRHRTALSQQDATTVDLTLTGKVGQFVNRVEERRRMIENLAPHDAAPARLVVVHGEKQSGKSSFLHWLRRWCALRGQRVKYVNLRDKDILDYSSALRAIRSTSEDLASLAPPVSRKSENAPGSVAAIEPNGHAPDDTAGRRSGSYFEPAEHRENAPPRHVVEEFASFFEDMKGSVSDSPLVLILDHLDGVVPVHFKSYFYPLFIERVIRGEVLDLRVIVTLDRNQSVSHWPAAQDRSTPQWIDVDYLDRDDFTELAEDAVLHFEGEFSEKDEALIERLAEYVDRLWEPSQLTLVTTLMRQGRRRAS